MDMGNGYEGSGGEGGRQSEPEEGSLRKATLTWGMSEGLRGGKEGGKRGGRERGQGERTWREGEEDREGGKQRERKTGREGVGRLQRCSDRASHTMQR